MTTTTSKAVNRTQKDRYIRLGFEHFTTLREYCLVCLTGFGALYAPHLVALHEDVTTTGDNLPQGREM